MWFFSLERMFCSISFYLFSSQLDACKTVVDLALDLEDYQTAKSFSEQGLHLATILFGPADTEELSKWENLTNQKMKPFAYSTK